MKSLSLFLPVLVFALCSASWAAAHKVNVFAYAEGNTIIGETSFSGGRPAKDADISVEDRVTGTVLLRTQTDDQGTFSFSVPEAARQERLDLRIVLLAGEGHRNEWVIRAEEYLPPAADNANPPAPNHSSDVSVQAEQSAEPQTWQEERLRQLLEEVVGEQIAPLKHLILQPHQPVPGLRDILGSLGYIIGIFGIIAWIKSRKGEKS